MAQRLTKAYEDGKLVGDAMGAGINEYLLPRLQQLEANLIDVLRQRLLTIVASSEHQPDVLAIVELRIFLKKYRESYKPPPERNCGECSGLV